MKETAAGEPIDREVSSTCRRRSRRGSCGRWSAWRSGRPIACSRSDADTAAAIRAGRVTVRTGALLDVELGRARFDLVAIDVRLFMGPCDHELARLREHLAHDGRVLTYYQAPTWPHAIRFSTEARGRLEASGFVVHVEEHPAIGVLVRARPRG